MRAFLRRSGIVLLAFALVAGTIAGNWSMIVRTCDWLVWLPKSWGGRPYHSTGSFVDIPRSLAARFVRPGDSVYFVVRGDGGTLTGSERVRQIGLSWMVMPEPVRFGMAANAPGHDTVFASVFLKGYAALASNLVAHAYVRVAEADGHALWMRHPPPVAAARAAPKPWQDARTFREAGGVMLALALLALAGYVLVRVHPVLRPAPGAFGPAVTGTLVFLAFALVATLLHTFDAPYGLGVFGGKAKLLWLCHGFPPGFAADPAWSTFQPAYPPGLTLLTLVADSVAGGCGEWLTQVLPVAALAEVLFFLCGRLRSWTWTFVLVTIFVVALPLRLAVLYYAEPFAWLCLLVGWECVRERGDDLWGWFLVGLAGFFRPEGIVVLGAVWLGVRLSHGRRAAPLAGFAAGAALPLVWILGCAVCGVATPGLRPLFEPDAAQACAALLRFFELAFLNPWLFGFVWWIALVAGGIPPRVLKQDIPARSQAGEAAHSPAFLSALFCLVALALTFAWRTDLDFGWLLDCGAERFLWFPALLLIRGIIEEVNSQGTVKPDP